MANMRRILIEAAMIVSAVTAGLSVSQAAHAAPLSLAMQAAASDPRADVKIDSRILVERTSESETGQMVTTLLDPATVKVIPGDTLLFINSYRNAGAEAVTGFMVNNAVHPAVALIEVVEDWAMVSVDGGQSFGALPDLSVQDTMPAAAAGDPSQGTSRPAKASDVTHIRWVLATPIAPGASGELRFRGIVK